MTFSFKNPGGNASEPWVPSDFIGQPVERILFIVSGWGFVPGEDHLSRDFTQQRKMDGFATVIVALALGDEDVMRPLGMLGRRHGASH